MTPSKSFDHMLGQSQAMLEVFANITKLAPTDLTILILGETGTGKELVARSLHARSERRRGPFVALNCAAIPSSLIESELFGFEKGSFTGAVAARSGHIEQADGGTLLLDEIAEMPLGAQSKLLRVLQDHRVQRVGASQDRKIDVRILAATHQDLPLLVQARAFRRDLYHRLDEVQLHLPRLADRNADIEIIGRSVLDRMAQELKREIHFAPAALQALSAYEWPGNVRELENCVRRAAITCSSEKIEPADLRLRPATASLSLKKILDAAREAAVRSSLRRSQNQMVDAARELEISVAELQVLVQRYEIR